MAKTPPTTKPAPIVVELATRTDKKGSVKYSTKEAGAAMSSAYIERTAFPDGMPDGVRITIEAL
jgi:hypothetical protein